MAVPEGYVTGKHKNYAEAVAEKFATLPPGGKGAVRLLLSAARETSPDAVRELLGNPRMQLEMKAPGMWAASARMDDMDEKIGPNVGQGKMFRYVDLAHRLYGAAVAGDGDVATVGVSWDGKASEGAKKLHLLGLTIDEKAGEEGTFVGSIKGNQIADLVANAKVLAVEVRSVVPAQ